MMLRGVRILAPHTNCLPRFLELLRVGGGRAAGRGVGEKMPWIHTHSFGPCLPVFQKRIRKPQTNTFLVVQNRLVTPWPYNTEEENPQGRGAGLPAQVYTQAMVLAKKGPTARGWLKAGTGSLTRGPGQGPPRPLQQHVLLWTQRAPEQQEDKAWSQRQSPWARGWASQSNF